MTYIDSNTIQNNCENRDALKELNIPASSPDPKNKFLLEFRSLIDEFYNFFHDKKCNIVLSYLNYEALSRLKLFNETKYGQLTPIEKAEFDPVIGNVEKALNFVSKWPFTNSGNTFNMKVKFVPYFKSKEDKMKGLNSTQYLFMEKLVADAKKNLQKVRTNEKKFTDKLAVVTEDLSMLIGSSERARSAFASIYNQITFPENPISKETREEWFKQCNF